MRKLFCLLLLISTGPAFCQNCDDILKKQHLQYDKGIQTYDLIKDVKEIAKASGRDTNNVEAILRNLKCDAPAQVPSFENPFIYCWLQSAFDRIETHLPKLGLKKVDNLCYGSLFLRTNVAKTELIDKHNVILFHASLFVFLDEFINLGLAKIDDKPGDSIIITDRTQTQTSKRLPITDSLLLKRTKELLEVFVNGDDSRTNKFTVDHHLTIYTPELSYHSILFIACHEYAHALAGDKIKSNIKLNELWERELNADRLGFKIYLSILSDDDDLSHRFLYYLTPLCYFSAVDFVEKNMYKKMNGESMPSSAERYDETKSFIKITNDKIQVDPQINHFFSGKSFYPPPKLRNEYIMSQVLNAMDVANQKGKEKAQMKLTFSLSEYLNQLSEKTDSLEKINKSN
jgi:hypothetical protein